jgi:hypothetical protein
MMKKIIGEEREEDEERFCPQCFSIKACSTWSWALPPYLQNPNAMQIYCYPIDYKWE